MILLLAGVILRTTEYGVLLVVLLSVSSCGSKIALAGFTASKELPQRRHSLIKVIVTYRFDSFVNNL